MNMDNATGSQLHGDRHAAHIRQHKQVTREPTYLVKVGKVIRAIFMMEERTPHSGVLKTVLAIHT